MAPSMYDSPLPSPPDSPYFPSTLSTFLSPLTVPTYNLETGLVGIKDDLLSPILVGFVVLFFLSTSNL